MPRAILIFSTCDSQEEGERIANALVNESLAACVNLIPGVKSVYRWQGRVETASELLLLIKTTPEYADQVQQRLAELHSYDTPEILEMPVERGSEKYLAWLRSSVSGGQVG